MSAPSNRAQDRLSAELDRIRTAHGEFDGNEGHTLVSLVEPVFQLLGWKPADRKTWHFHEGGASGPVRFDLLGPRKKPSPLVHVEVRAFGNPLHVAHLDSWSGRLGENGGARLAVVTNALRWVAFRPGLEAGARPVEAFAVDLNQSEPYSALHDLAALSREVLESGGDPEEWLSRISRLRPTPRVDPLALRDRIIAGIQKGLKREVKPILDRDPEATVYAGTFEPLKEGTFFSVRIDPRSPVRVFVRVTLRGERSVAWVRAEIRRLMEGSSYLRTRRAELEELRFERDHRKVDEWHLALPPVAVSGDPAPITRLVRQSVALLRAFSEAVDRL